MGRNDRTAVADVATGNLAAVNIGGDMSESSDITASEGTGDVIVPTGTDAGLTTVAVVLGSFNGIGF